MYYVYKTINKINKKFYIGVHKSNNIENDDYLGSGILIKKAIEKYGIENFERYILCEFNDRNEAYNLEKELVDKSNKFSYNLKEGGYGGWDYVNSLGLKNCMKNLEIRKKNIESHKKNKSYSSEKFQKACRENIKKAIEYNTDRSWKKESKEKLSNSLKEYYKKHESILKGKKLSEKEKQKRSDGWSKEKREKQSILQKERIKNNPSIVITNKGKKFSEETKQKMSIAAKNSWKKGRQKIKCPYCGKEGYKNNMIRWHFDNCKLKEK